MYKLSGICVWLPLSPFNLAVHSFTLRMVTNWKANDLRVIDVKSGKTWTGSIERACMFCTSLTDNPPPPHWPTFSRNSSFTLAFRPTCKRWNSFTSTKGKKKKIFKKDSVFKNTTRSALGEGGGEVVGGSSWKNTQSHEAREQQNKQSQLHLQQQQQQNY